MKIRAVFPTVFRGVEVIADVRGELDTARATVIATFTRDGVPHDFGELTREELAALCREAAKVKRMPTHPMPLEQARKVLPPIWVVYESPSDYPGEWVARVWYGLTPSPEVIRAPTLVQLRELIVAAGGSMPMMRAVNDDPVIRETWI